MTGTPLKVLWMCNCALTGTDVSSTGTWLEAMAQGLIESQAVRLGVIAFGNCPGFVRQDCAGAKQWLVPVRKSLASKGLPDGDTVGRILATCEEFSPDVVHVWGTETFWGLLTARKLWPRRALLGMQGLKGAVAKAYMGDLTLAEQLRCIGIKEVLRRQTLTGKRRDYARWGTFETEIIRGHHYISVQSPWIEAQVRAVNSSARLYKTECVLRRPFERASAWQPSDSPTVFCSAAHPTPAKGLHTAVRAVAVLRERMPGIRLRIAGAHQRPGLRQEGYSRWLNALVRHLGLQEHVDWLGSLNAEQLVAELHRASAVLVPTFVESYSLALAEAMRVGAPTVVSYTGGTGYLGRDEDTCLFCAPGDHAMCAFQLERLLTDRDLALRLSVRAREVAARRHDRAAIVEEQIRVYQQIRADQQTSH